MDAELKPEVEPIPGYRLVERLGRGGFGEVWKAQGPGGFEVALKFVALADRVGEVESRSLDAIRNVRHPHLLGLFGSWVVDGRLVIAMELADRTLMDRFRECVDRGFAGIPAPEIFEHFLEAAKALDFLNEFRHPSGPAGGSQGIQHRDVKPQNLLLVGGSVKVGDFGLARVLENSLGGHSGSLTLAYAPPEFFEHKTSAQSDQYSLAVTYCQMRGGRLPFEGSPAAIMAGHLSREPDLSMIPDAERPRVARALAKSPKDRWPSCRAFVEATSRSAVPWTDRVREGRGGSMTTAPCAPRDPQEARETVPMPLGTTRIEFGTVPTPPRRRKRRRFYLGAVWSLALLGLAVSFGFLLRETRKDATSPISPPGPGGEIAFKVDSVRKEAKARVERGLQLLDAGERARALREFGVALGLEPEDARAHAGRALALAREGGHRDEALADAGRAIRSDPKLALGYAARGLARSEPPDSDYEQALADGDRAVSLDPSLADGYLSRSMVNARRAERWGAMGSDLQKAEEDAREAIRRNPGSAEAHLVLGTVLRFVGRLDEATAAISEAIRINPGFADAYINRALCRNGKGDHAGAIEDATTALKLAPESSAAFLARADAFDARGDRARAAADRDRAEQLLGPKLAAPRP